MKNKNSTTTNIKKNITFHVITLFPESFSSYMGESILARAQKAKLVQIKFYNPRDFVKATGAQKGKENPYLRVDDKPYGGGPGMVMQALPIAKAVEKALKSAQRKKDYKRADIVFLSPSGKQFTNDVAGIEAVIFSDIIIICGRYEGIDARIKKMFKVTEISIGPYVTTGGELPAMVMIDAISRHIPGVLGNFDSREEYRVSTSDVYTRPEVVEFEGKKYKVPPVLLSGNHKEIDSWKESKEGVKKVLSKKNVKKSTENVNTS